MCNGPSELLAMARSFRYNGVEPTLANSDSWSRQLFGLRLVKTRRSELRDGLCGPNDNRSAVSLPFYSSFLHHTNDRLGFFQQYPWH